MSHRVTLIPGDGIGPEVTAATIRIIKAAGVEIDWDWQEAGLSAIQKYGDPLPDKLLDSIRSCGLALKGPLSTPVAEGFTSINVQLRKILDLYANYRPIRSFPGVETPYKNVDLIIVRENTESLYSGLEHVVVPGVVESLKIITERASMRIAKFAFELARCRGRKKITVVHKANIMKLSDGLFLNCVRKVAAQYPEVRYDELIVDNAAMQLVLNPRQFDIILTENLYGDIISDLAAGLIGGLGLAPSANLGDNCAVFEPVHGSAPDLAGKNLANPTAMVLSSLMLLEHLGERVAAERISGALVATYKDAKVLTKDLGGNASTTEFADAVISHLG